MAEYGDLLNGESTEAALLAIIDSTVDAIVIIDQSGIIQSYNRAAQSIFGYSAEEAIGQKVNLLMPPATAAAHDRYLETYLVGGVPKVIGRGREVFGQAKDGRQMPLYLAVSEVRVKGDRLFTGIMRDISELKQTRNYLAESRQRLLALLDMMPYGVFEASNSGAVTLVNRALEGMSGYNRQELLGQELWTLLDSDHVLERALAGDGRRDAPETLFTLLNHKAGPLVEIRLDWTYRLGPGGSRQGLVGVISDISRERKARRELSASEERFRALVESSPDWVWETDARGAYTYASPRIRDILGYEPHQVIGRTPFELMPPEEAERMAELFRGLVGRRAPLVNMENVNLHRDGRPVVMETSGRPIIDGSGRLAGYRGVDRDITERKQTELRLLKAKDAAESADRAKSEFLAVMSHELRTPLNAILGFSEVLKQESFGPLNPKQARYVDHIFHGGQQLLKLVDGILDLASLSAGHSAVTTSPVGLGGLLEAAIGLLRETARNQGLDLALDLTSEVAGLTVMADEPKVKQVLFNILSNALKFTPSGGRVRLSAARDGREAVVTVSDNGMGLTAEEMQKLFVHFGQGDSSYARRAEGAGLGLALASQLVTAHGGKIWAESPGRGQGSDFRFTLPLASDKAA